jgi:cytosine deaminase
VNLHLQGRFHGYPKRRGLARVAELMRAGVPVAMAQDCVLDPWYPLGQADLLDIAWLGAHACHLADPAGLQACFAAVTDVPARILGLRSGTLAPGEPATLVLLDARDPVEAIRTRAIRRAVIRNGRVLARTDPVRPVLDLPEPAF